jgi:hypothetical protein
MHPARRVVPMCVFAEDEAVVGYSEPGTKGVLLVAAQLGLWPRPVQQWIGFGRQVPLTGLHIDPAPSRTEISSDPWDPPQCESGGLAAPYIEKNALLTDSVSKPCCPPGCHWLRPWGPSEDPSLAPLGSFLLGRSEESSPELVEG